MTEQGLSLYELNALVREAIEGEMNREYWVRAELSEIRESRGHCYMELVEMYERARGRGSEGARIGSSTEDSAGNSDLAPSLPRPLDPSSLLIQMVIRHGDEIIIRNAKNEETGEIINLNVAQYINYDLSLDNLHLSSPLYAQILQEALEHSNTPGFKSVDYFTHHPDIAISQLAVSMSIDTVQLAESLKLKEQKNSLRDRVTHLVLDFRMDYVEQQLKLLRNQVATMAGNVDAMMATMSEIKRMQDIRNVLAKRLGKP